MQILDFVVTALLLVGAAVGLRRASAGGAGSTWTLILIALTGVGLVVAGVFPADAGAGFPAGAPEGAPVMSAVGAVHEVGFVLTAADRPRRWRSASSSAPPSNSDSSPRSRCGRSGALPVAPIIAAAAFVVVVGAIAIVKRAWIVAFVEHDDRLRFLRETWAASPRAITLGIAGILVLALVLLQLALVVPVQQ